VFLIPNVVARVATTTFTKHAIAWAAGNMRHIVGYAAECWQDMVLSRIFDLTGEGCWV
jgi:hypothetical protein